jgi:hypothetical protein
MPRRFPFRLEAGRLTIAGVEVAGLTVTGEIGVAAGEIAAQLEDRMAPPAVVVEEPRPPGRPSYDGLLAQAIVELGERLERRAPRAVQARQVLRHLAQKPANAGSIPTRRCIARAGQTGRSSRNRGREASRSCALPRAKRAEVAVYQGRE